MLARLRTQKMFVSESKTLKGFTLIEALVAFLILTILISTFLYVGNPPYRRSKTKDQVRIKDAATLDHIITEYMVDNSALPGFVDTLYTSNTLPQGQAGPMFSSTSGWLLGDFSSYAQTLPLDPDNADTLIYSYQHNGTTYEVNAYLEVLTDYSLQDGGDDATLYELGSNLNIL